MTSAESWAVLDRAAGVPVVFSVDARGRVVTCAPRVAASREPSVPHRDDMMGHAQRIAALVTAHLDLDAVAQSSTGSVEVDLSSDAWLERCRIGTRLVVEAAADARRTRPALRSIGRSLTWDAAAHDVGLDALVWAALLSASKAPPLTVGQGLADLTSRRDANPLARARRAQAAATTRLETAAGLTTSDDAFLRATGSRELAVSAPLRAALLLTSRAFHDATRTGRTRPALLAIDELAAAMLRHVEAAPVTRTDVPALSAARSIVRETLDAAGVAAPVPY